MKKSRLLSLLLTLALAAGLLAGTLVLLWYGTLNLTLPLLSIWLLAGSLGGKKYLHLSRRRGRILRTQ